MDFTQYTNLHNLTCICCPRECWIIKVLLQNIASMPYTIMYSMRRMPCWAAVWYTSVYCVYVLCAVLGCCVVHQCVLRVCTVCRAGLLCSTPVCIACTYVLCANLGCCVVNQCVLCVRMYCVPTWAVLWQCKQGQSNPLHIVTSVEVHKIDVVERKD